MTELLYRTEDFRLEEVLQYYVETPADRRIVNGLKGRSPIILKGSRGVGKSFLLRVAEAELKNELSSSKNLPVYLTFARAGLIRQSADGFLSWMIAKIAGAVTRAIVTNGLAVPPGTALSQLMTPSAGLTTSTVDRVSARFEEFWRSDGTVPETELLPEPEILKEALADICDALDLHRITLLVDEAAHVFIPDQQRQFFTLMRDLRSAYVSVKAAVYPGATAFGESFQPSHDATTMNVERTINDESYPSAMREIVLKQASVQAARQIRQYGDAFDTLAFAATGNPRTLLKTFDRRTPFNTGHAQDTIRQYYREEIWAEHSMLADRYPGHRILIDWGRKFIEDDVLPALYQRNQGHESQMSSAIWIHRDAPQAVRESLSLLCYSGILQEGVSGIRATRSEIGTRYLINLGCNLAQAADPVPYGRDLRRQFDIRRMQEFGSNHAAYRSLEGFSIDAIENRGNAALEARLEASIDNLDLSTFLRSKLQGDLGLTSIREVLAASEQDFQKAHYVGQVRSRQMRNAAVTAVIEYLSG